MLYFISDLHLSNNKKYEVLINNFLKFCDFLILQQKNKANHNIQATNNSQNSNLVKLYILGDLFDLWLGDDIIQPELYPVIEKIRNLYKSNIQTFFIRGNRDFLISNKFSKLTNCTVLQDPSIIATKNNEKILISHGDMFCTNDKPYQIFKFIVQSKITKLLFLTLPKKLRIKIANNLRKISKKENKKKLIKNQDLPKNTNSLKNNKPKNLFDINQNYIIKLLQKYNSDLIIHGHIHKEILEDINNIEKNIKYKYIVLPDWRVNSEIRILEYKNNNFRFVSLSDLTAQG